MKYIQRPFVPSFLSVLKISDRCGLTGSTTEAKTLNTHFSTKVPSNQIVMGVTSCLKVPIYLRFGSVRSINAALFKCVFSVYSY